MKMTLRKIASVTAAVAMSLAMMVATAAPANAQARPPMAFDAVTPAIINQPFDVDYSCYKDANDPNAPDTDTGDPWYLEPDMVLPPGLTFDSNDNHIKGTPTEIGSFKLPLMTCLQGGVNGFYEGIRVGTILVSPLTTPNPQLALTQVNTADCGYELQLMLPSTPDAGTINLTFTTATATATATLTDILPMTIYQILVKGGSIQSLRDTLNVASVSPAGDIPISCDDEVSIKLSYQSFGAPASWMELVGYTPSAKYSTPSLQSESYNDAACTIRVTGVLPSLAFDTTPQLYIATDVFGYYIDLDEVSSGKMFSYEFPLSSKEAIEALDGVKSVTSWGTVPNCVNQFWFVTLNALNEGYENVTVDANLVINVPPVQCVPGSYSQTGSVPCTQAEPGYFVVNSGERAQTPCPVGTFSADAGSTSCQLAPKGYFVRTTGADKATKCAAGMTTELTGARSINECYKQKFQTAKAIKSPAKLKFGAKHETAGRADAGMALDAVATGSCTVTKINKTVKINGKSVKQPRWVIKATSKAGNCKVTFSNDGDYTYKPFTVTKTIKVTKTGK
jgi:hypothetical protein